MLYQIEFTDTFSGEANYSWVKRATFEASEYENTSTLVRLGKKALGLSGRHRRSVYSDTIRLDFVGECTCAFITSVED